MEGVGDKRARAVVQMFVDEDLFCVYLYVTGDRGDMRMIKNKERGDWVNKAFIRE